MNTYFAVIGVIKHKDKILLLKRSPNRKFSPNRWQPVSGFPKEKESAEECALREVKEETGFEGKIIKKSNTFEFEDEFGHWINVVFLIEVLTDQVSIDPKEHSEYKWINPSKFKNYECIKGVEKDLELLNLLDY